MGNGFSSNDGVYIAKENYTPLVTGPDDPNNKVLRIRKGDKLILKRPIPPDDPGSSENVNWKAPPDYEKHRQALEDFGDKVYFMKNTRTNKKGFITRSYVAKEGTLECKDWYFGNIKRTQATHFLSYPFNTDGSFLIRDSEKPNCYALTIKVFRNSQFDYKHYLIKQDNGKTFYISEKQQYPSLGALIQACRSGEVDDVLEKLGNVCLKPRATGRAPGNSFDDSHLWFINREDLTMEKTPISSGTFGEVYRGQLGCTNVAIKSLKCDRPDVGQTRAVAEFTQETSVLKLLHHPNLVQCFGVCNDASPFYMITEWLNKGDVRSYLIEHLGKGTDKLLNFDVLIRICENIASGMNELSKKRIIHRDLAARNVMLDDNLVAKVGDFGLARVASEYSNEQTKFPIKWTAPEGLEKHVFTCKSDVWSFGITLWEIFSGGAVPYGTQGCSSADLAEKLKTGFRLKVPNYPAEDGNEKFLNAIYMVMLQCWQLDPDRRPAFDVLHEDFANFDTAVEKKYNESPRYVLAKSGFFTKLRRKKQAVK